MNRNLPELVLAGLMLFAPPMVRASTLEGQAFDDTISVANTELRLNGLGLRAVMFVKGYVAGLYLPARASSVTDIAAAGGPKRLQLRMMRAASADDFVDAMTSGMRKNSSAQELQALHDRMRQLTRFIQAAGSARVGDVVNFDYVPEVGTTLTLNGKAQGKPIPGSDFYIAVLKVFIGEHPVDRKLKQGLLGGVS
jgi:hypothetical protein